MSAPHRAAIICHPRLDCRLRIKGYRLVLGLGPKREFTDADVDWLWRELLHVRGLSRKLIKYRNFM
jgi:hypothetical protein